MRAVPRAAGAEATGVDAGGATRVESAPEAVFPVAEAAVAWELARAAHEKFGGDSVGDFVGAWRAYLQRIEWS